LLTAENKKGRGLIRIDLIKVISNVESDPFLFAKATKTGKIFKVDHVDMMLSDFTGIISAVNDEAQSGYTRVNYIKDGANLGGFDIRKTVKGSSETVKFNRAHILNALRDWSESGQGLLLPDARFRTLTKAEAAEVEELEAKLKALRG